MKNLLFFFLLILSLSGAEKIMRIPVNASQQQEVWFIDLSAVKTKDGTVYLRSDKKESVRFSLDKRYGPVHASGQYVRPPDGFYTKHQAEMNSASLVQVGLISFRPPKGSRYCELYYTEGCKNITAKPDPSLRPWWVEIFKDPSLNGNPDKPFYSQAGSSRIVKTGQGFLFQQNNGKYPATLFFYPAVLNLDPRLADRRLNAALCWESAGNVKGNFSLPLRNGKIPQIGVINYYIQSPAGKYTGVMEGIFETGKPEWREKTKRGSISFSNGTLLRKIHLQSLPTEGNLQLIPQTRSVYAEELLQFKKVNFDQEIFQQYNLDRGGEKMKAFRLLQPVQNRKIRLSLTDRQGHQVSQSDSAELFIPKIPAGEYQLSMEVFEDGMEVLHEQCRMTILTSPWK